MKVGRELDKLVAEKVMNCKVKEINAIGGFQDKYECICKHKSHSQYSIEWQEFHGILPYSTKISAAWGIIENLDVEFMLDKGVEPDSWLATFHWLENGEDQRFSSEGYSAPHAICLAALKAVGINTND